MFLKRSQSKMVILSKIAYLFETQFSIARVISCQESCSQLHDILQIDSFTCILLSKDKEYHLIVQVYLIEEAPLTLRPHQRLHQHFLRRLLQSLCLFLFLLLGHRALILRLLQAHLTYSRVRDYHQTYP